MSLKGHLGNSEVGGCKDLFQKKGSFGKGVFSEEILENPQTVENKGESDHFLEILVNLEISEILEIPPVKRPLS